MNLHGICYGLLYVSHLTENLLLQRALGRSASAAEAEAVLQHVRGLARSTYDGYSRRSTSDPDMLSRAIYTWWIRTQDDDTNVTLWESAKILAGESAVWALFNMDSDEGQERKLSNASARDKDCHEAHGRAIDCEKRGIAATPVSRHYRRCI